MGFRTDLTGKIFGKLTVIGFDYERNMWYCTCSCGGNKYVKTKDLTMGNVKSCGCLHRERISKDITGKRFGNLVAIKLDHRDKDGRAHWECKCDCGNTVVVAVKILTVGNKTTCGNCLEKEMVGRRFGSLVVIEKSYVKNRKQYWKCKCDCGNYIFVNTGSLHSGNTKSCGCSRYNYENLLGRKFNMLTPVKYVEANKWLCICDCGNTTIVLGSDLKRNSILSCGCNNISKNGSLYENEIRDFIYRYVEVKDVILHDKKALNGREIDIYLPKYKLGVEYNGSPFHATENGLYRNVDKYYHRNKFLCAKEKGIQLITVFDDDYFKNKWKILDRIRNIIFGNVDIFVPHASIEYTNNDYDSGEWIRNYGYEEVGQEEPDFFIYQNKYKVYRCGRTIWKEV